MTDDDARLDLIYKTWRDNGIITHLDVAWLFELAQACDCELRGVIEAVKE